MKKKKFGRSRFARVLLSVALVAAMLPTFAFAANDEELPVEGSPGSDAVTENEVESSGDEVFDESDIDSSDKSDGDAGQDIEAGAEGKDEEDEAEVAIAPLSQTDGENTLQVNLGDGITWTDVDTIGNTNTWDLSVKQKQLQIDAQFSGQGDRSIVVTVPLGYKILEYTVKTGTPAIEGVGQIGLSQEYSDKVASSTLTDLQGNDWTTQAIKGYSVEYRSTEKDLRTYAGKIVYKLNSNCDRIILNLTLGLQQEIMPHAASTAMLDAVDVELVSGGKALQSSLTTQVTTLTYATMNTDSRVAIPIDASVANPSATFTTKGALWMHHSATGAQPHVEESFVYEITYPEGISFEGFKEEITGVVAESDSAGGSYGRNSADTAYHLVVENDTLARTVTFTYTDVRVAHGMQFSFYWTVDVNATGITLPWDGSSIDLDFPTTLLSTTGTAISNPQIKKHNAATITARIDPDGWSLKLSPQNRMRWDWNTNGNYPYDYTLGGIAVENEGPSQATDLTYTWSFSPNLAVRQVSFPGLIGNDITDVTATVKDKITGAQRQVSAAGPFATPYNSVHQGIYVSDDDMGLSSSEYILTLSAHQEALDARTFHAARTWSSANYYGRFQNQSTGSATLTITSPNGFSVTATDTPSIGWSVAGGGSAVTTATHYDTESNKWVSGTWYPSSQLRLAAYYNAGFVLTDSNEAVDPTVIISMPKGITLDTGSVMATSEAGNNAKKPVVLQLLSMQQEVYDASTGITWTIYRYSSKTPYDMIGQEDTPAQLSNESRQIKVTFNATVSSSCGAMALDAKDLVQWDLGRTAVTKSDGINYCITDTLNRSGRIDGSSVTSYNLVAGTQSGQFFVAQKPGLNVSLGIRTLGSTDDFYTYDGTDATVAPLSAGGSAEVALSYVNSSTDNYEAGTEIYLPIPKKDVDYTGIFNNVANDPYNNTSAKESEFDLSLTGPIALPGFKTLYTIDTSGDVEDNSGLIANNWTPVNYTWIEESAMSAQDYAKVTMVKFVATVPIDPYATAGTTFTAAVSDQAGFAEQNYWRSYQKGWTNTSGAGSWIYGSVLATETIKAGVIGKVFDDKNKNGIMDTGEAYDNTDGNITAILTGTTIQPVTLTVAADGSISTPAGYGLRVGKYTVNVTNGDNVMEFSPTSADVDGGKRSDASAWLMDIQQADINAARTSGTFTFSVTKGSSLNEEYVGVGLSVKPIITYKANNSAGTNFSDVSVALNHGSTASGAPALHALNTTAGYNLDTEAWTFDKDVVLTDGTTVAAGDPLTRAQLYTVKVTENLVATVSLSLNTHSISYGYVENASGDPIPDNAPSLAGYGSADVAFGSNVSRESGPVLKGHTFSGWTTSDVTIAPDGSFVMPDNDVTFSGSWTANSYTVTYNGNGSTAGIAPAPTDVTFGENFTTATYDTFSRTGYTFAGWNTSADGSGTSFAANETKPYLFDEDITLYAQWDPKTGVAYTVQHYLVDSNGVAVLNYTEARTGTVNSLVNASPRNYAPSHTFNSVYPGTASSGTIPASGTLTLRLYYSINIYTVIFVDHDGAQLAASSVPYGGSATAPANPTRLGYTFAGWDRGFANVTSNITVTALYTPNPIIPVPVDPIETYTITFLGYNDTVLQSSTVDAGGSVSPPSSPVRKGFRFTGWDHDSSAWTNVSADATIRAMWNDEVVTTTPGSTQRQTPVPNNDESSPAEELARAAAEQNIPSIGVPLAAPQGFAAWALANLILAVLGIVMALVFGVIRRFRKNDEEDDREEREQRRRAQNIQSEASEDDGPFRHRRSIGWLIATIALAIIGAILFLLTQDISLPVVWVDMWTIAHAILVIALVIFGNFAVGRKKIKQDEEDQKNLSSENTTGAAM